MVNRCRRRCELASRALALVVAAACFPLAGCNRSLGEPEAQATSVAAPGKAVLASQTGNPVPDLTLEESQRDYLWQIEHHGNLLAKYGFGQIKPALAKGDRKALSALLAGDFRGAIYAQPHEVRLNNDFLQVVRKQEAKERHTLTAPEFLAQLGSFRQVFGPPPKVAMNLMKLAPEEAGNLESPIWQGSCLLRMYGQTARGEPVEISLNLEYRIARPTEETLARKAWLHSAAIVQSVEGRARQYLLHDVTRERGIDPGLFHDNWVSDQKITISGGVFLCDFDRDGILDLLVTDTNGYFLYKGLPGGKFRDVTREMGLPRRAVERGASAPLAAFVDLDGDGWEDLVLGNHIYRNEEGKQFIDFTYRSNLHIPSDAGGIALADYDRDGFVDLYVTRSGRDKKDSWLGGKSGDTRGNQLWRNKGNWQFEDVTETSGTSGGLRSTFTAVWLDANNDGWPDLYVTNEFGNGVLLVNNGDGTFHEQQLAEGPNDFGTMGVTCGDIDNDGNIDLYCANMYSKAGSRVIGNLRPDTYPEEIMAKMRQFVAGSQLWRNRGNLQFDKLGQRCQVAAVGWAYGPALVDLDNDGWLDLYATAGFVSSSRDEPDG
jgi:FG-GAP-like repeat